METSQGDMSVKDLVELSQEGFLAPNPEYQRGEVWKLPQQKKLLDSLMRGYELPIIYLHDIKRTVAGKTQERYEIIDGQQRIKALRLFVEGGFPLYNVEDSAAKFPAFLQGYECPWGGKDFDGLPGDLRSKVLDTKLRVALIKTEDKNEVRDLFVRLQSGLPLNAQEKRDSYPGDFTDFVLKLGGKPGVDKYPGHEFFQRVLKMKSGGDRGATRQLAAQIAILFMERRRVDPDFFSNIDEGAVTEYYHTHLDFDTSSPECDRLREILEKLSSLLGNWKGPKLRAHNAIHLVLFLDSIWDDYTRSWEDKLEDAQKQFSATLTQAAQAAKNGDTGKGVEAHLRYGQYANQGSHRGDNIRRRHRYYTARMVEFLDGLTPKDPKRAFNQLEREVIYWRAGGKCRVCSATVEWSDAEAHHVIEHQDGGQTVLGNGVLVHKACHPKGEAAKELARQWGYVK